MSPKLPPEYLSLNGQRGLWLYHAIWQKSLGYKGKDADGIPGWSSLSKLIARGNYYLVP